MYKKFISNGFFLMIAASVMFAFSDVFIKSISRDFSPFLIGFVRYFLGIALLIPIMKHQGHPIKGSSHWLLILRGVFGQFLFFAKLNQCL